MLLVGGEARLDRVVRAAEPLQPGRDLGVTQIRVIPAVAADDLERSGVAVFQTTWGDALAPQARRELAMAGLTRRRDNPAVRSEVRRASRLLAGHGIQTVAAHQRSWPVVHRCRGLEQHDDSDSSNPTPRSALPLMEY